MLFAVGGNSICKAASGCILQIVIFDALEVTFEQSFSLHFRLAQYDEREGDLSAGVDACQHVGACGTILLINLLLLAADDRMRHE